MKINLIQAIIMLSKYTAYGLACQMLFFNLLLANEGNAQKTVSVREVQIVLNSGDLKVKEIFNQIERKSDFRFAIDKNDLKLQLNQKVNINTETKTVSDILIEISRESRLKFRQVNNNITVTRLKDNKVQEEIDFVIEADVDISGKITDENGEGLPGATVIQKGTANGVTTDLDGNYKLSVSEESILTISFVGYLTQEVEIGTRGTIDVQMDLDATQLDEIVVVGYGTQEKRNVSGSISSVDSKVLMQTQAPSADVSLQGRMPGVYVTTNGGQPGGGVYVRIRGAGTINNSNPLYVIDGIIIPVGNSENSNPLATINPNDIESIDILKDAASSAIYGARAANGVVLITTKKGKTGEPTLRYSSYVGTQKAAIKQLRPMNAREFGEFMNKSFEAAGDPIPFSNPSSLGEGTNWMKEGTRTGTITDHQLSISGGTESSKYYVSLNYFNNQGIMRRTYQNRFSIRVNTDNQINKAIKIGNTLMYSRSSQLNNNAGNRTFIHGAYTGLYQALPTVPVYDDNPESSSTGFGGPTDVNLERQRNIISSRDRPTRDNLTDRVLGSVYLDVELFKGLTFRSTVAVDIRRESDYSFESSWTEGLLNSNGLSNLSQSRNNNDFWQWDNVLRYNNSIEDHNFSVIAGTSAQESKFTNLNTSGQYDTDVFTQFVSGAASLQSFSSLSEESLASVFGRVTYDFKSKYLLTAALRRDGSSKFGPNNKFGVFPSFTVGWRISDENFIQTDGFLSDLKIRGGWGQVGSDAIGNFRYLAQMNSTFDYAFGNQTALSSLGVALQDLANRDVQWETATEYNFGIDAVFLDGRLNFSTE
ncbi:MAG: SusC/RagA family TonB-linked outer membrane protein, partial [Cyclobacteriaceae bacterium]|nr:SusC/RagA family TonB-linked outer membrane protein [Cyclobacteriaceae bacterium]